MSLDTVTLAAADGMPIISNPFGNGISLNSNNFVCGFIVQDVADAAIFGSEVSDATVESVDIAATRDGIVLETTGGVFDFSGGSITRTSDDPTGAAVRVIGGAPDFTWDGVIDVFGGYLLEVDGTFGGEVVMDGGPLTITSPDTAVRVVNTNAPVTFSSLVVNGGRKGIFIENSNTDVGMADVDINDIEGTGVTVINGGASQSIDINFTPTSMTASATGDLLSVSGNATGGFLFLSGGPMQSLLGGGGISVSGDMDVVFDNDIDLVDATLDLTGFTGQADFNGAVTIDNTEGAPGIVGDGGQLDFSGGVQIDIADADAIDVSGNAEFRGSFGPISISGDADVGIYVLGNGAGNATFSDLDIDLTSGQWGLNVQNIGVVNFTGTNRVANASGSGVRVYANTIGGSGATFESISSTGGFYGLSLGLLTGDGFHVVGDGSPGSGGTIHQAITAGVYIVTAPLVELTDLNITDATGDGIRGISVDQFNLDDITISGAGTTFNDLGIELSNSGSDGALWRNLNITGSRGDNIGLFWAGSSTGDVVIENSTLNGSVDRRGLFVRTETSASARVEVTNSSMNGNRFEGVYGQTANAAGLDLVVQGGSTVNSNLDDYGAKLENLGTGTLRAAFSNSTMSNNAASGIGIFQSSDAPVELTVFNTTISRASAGTATRGIVMSPGITRSDVIVDVGGTSSILGFDYPILLTSDAFGFDVSQVDLTVSTSGSFVSDGDGNALYLESDSGMAEMCADLSGVTLDGGGVLQDGFFWNRSASSVFEIVGYSTSVLNTLGGLVTLTNGTIFESGPGPFTATANCRSPFSILS